MVSITELRPFFKLSTFSDIASLTYSASKNASLRRLMLPDSWILLQSFRASSQAWKPVIEVTEGVLPASVLYPCSWLQRGAQSVDRLALTSSLRVIKKTYQAKHKCKDEQAAEADKKAHKAISKSLSLHMIPCSRFQKRCSDQRRTARCKGRHAPNYMNCLKPNSAWLLCLLEQRSDPWRMGAGSQKKGVVTQ